jgi:hypothetical protein
MVARAGTFITSNNIYHKGQSLCNEFVWSQSVELHSALLSQVKVPVVCRVAELAGSDDELQFVSVGMSLGKEMVPRKR